LYLYVETTKLNRKYTSVRKLAQRPLTFLRGLVKGLFFWRDRMKECKYCGKEYHERGISYHEKFCKQNPNRSSPPKKTKAWYDAMKTKKKGNNLITNGIAMSEETKEKLRQCNIGKKLSKETREKLSNHMKKYYKENPDKHPWRQKNRLVSAPCNHLKKRLREAKIDFVDECCPFGQLDEPRFFSVDIAFPDQKFGIEVNGTQHYVNKQCGQLTQYYQDRHNYFKDHGWTLLELPYKMVYNIKLESLFDFDAFERDCSDFRKSEQERKKEYQKKRTCKKCGKKRTYRAKHNLCRKCYCETLRKVEWPTKEDLTEDIQKMTWEAIGKKHGVSSTSVRKWARKYELI